MMRALWTGASGMISQQMNVDTIANNLANVNTYSFKKERTEFKTLLYQTMRSAGDTQNDRNAQPVNHQIGLGVRPIAVTKQFDQGVYMTSNAKSDVTINGDGFFVVDKGNGELSYTRDGSFKYSYSDEGLTLVTSEGYLVLSAEGEPIIFENDIIVDNITINANGTFTYFSTAGQPTDMGVQLQIVQFPNRQGLEFGESNLYTETVASGVPVSEIDGTVEKRSTIVQGVLEGSNVQVAEEMVNLITAQRAYEINSKVITTSDEMLSQANQLKR